MIKDKILQNMTITEKYKPYIKNVLKNRCFFDDLLDKIQNADATEVKQKLAKSAINFALANSTGYYSSSIIENVFLDIAGKNTIENLPQEFKSNSFLHVMTRSYSTGGHTRVVERWIEAAGKEETHSVIFTGFSESKFIPERLNDAVKNKNGSITFIDYGKTDIEKGLELRKTASSYQAIILHIHMYDIIPLIAFGHNEFKRPVIFYNHADHQFWVGTSISDIVADIKENGQELTLKKRGVKNSFLLNVPIETKEIQIIQKQEARNKLKLPKDKKIILTIGTAYKYRSILDLNFIKMIEPILKEDKNIICIGIGPKRELLPEWEKAEKKYPNQIFPLGDIPYNELHDYIFAADIIIDGIPFGGGTALIDAVSCNRPILLINNPFGQFDYAIKSIACCKDIVDLGQKAKQLLYDEELQSKNIKDVLYKLNQNNGIDHWQANLKKLISILPNEHSIDNFSQQIDNNLSDRDAFNYLNNLNEKEQTKIITIPFLFNLYKLKDLYSSRTILNIMNMNLILRNRERIT